MRLNLSIFKFCNSLLIEVLVFLLIKVLGVKLFWEMGRVGKIRERRYGIGFCFGNNCGWI